MKEDVLIRKATQNDLAILYEMMQEVARAERPFDETIKEGFVEYYNFNELINDANCYVVVAEISGEVIASGLVQIRQGESYRTYDYYAYLGSMYVHPLHRGKGVNQQIMDELKRFALSKGITELRLEVYPDNLPAIKAYQKAGFATLLIQMRMRL